MDKTTRVTILCMAVAIVLTEVHVIRLQRRVDALYGVPVHVDFSIPAGPTSDPSLQVPLTESNKK
jgi:hypothetical protein